MQEISSKVWIEAGGHAAGERSMLSQYVTDDNTSPTANAVDRVLDALWEMLSGVCRCHAIAC